MSHPLISSPHGVPTIVAAVAILLGAEWPALAQPASDRPKVRVIATGGTIAGEQQQPGTLTGYEIKRSADDLVKVIPSVRQYAEVETEQFSNLASPTITPAHWLRLARRINQVFAERPDLSGVVVTHGTSRLEETAFFLYLTIKSDRPVVVVGAQRPATGVGPDGPINLLSAIRVAAAPTSRGKGVTVVMDDRVISAREAKKIYARSGGFDGGEMGMLGVVGRGGVDYLYAPARKHTLTSDFDVSSVETLPRVSISYSYAGAEGAADTRAKAVIVATTGFAVEEAKYYDALRAKGVIVATTFPSGEQVASGPEGSASNLPPMIAVKHLTPLKARVLMMLALTRSENPAEIQRIFEAY